MNPHKDTLIIIPALNEADSIALVLKDIPKDRIREIIVVDNGSTDQTAQIAKDHGALVVSQPIRGYGQACLAGIKKANEYSIENIIFLDADYSDHPEEMSLLLEKLDEGFEIVIGSRTLGKAEPGALLLQARFGNWLSTFLLRILFRDKTFHDLGPFRGIKQSALNRLKMEDTNFGWTIEMQLKAILFNLKRTEVSVSYRKRIGVSKITGTLSGTCKAGYKILFTIAWTFIRTKLLARSETRFHKIP